jgi:nucleotide-binding universal stress UspA family protein
LTDGLVIMATNTPSITNILCPVDFSDSSRAAIKQAVAVAGFYKTRITALHVLSPLSFAVHGVAAAAMDDVGIEHLRRLTAAELAAATRCGIGVDVLVDVGQAAATILDRAATLAADMVVMGTHGTSGFQHILLGSVTEKVLRTARCPVLTVPPHSHCRSELPFRSVLCSVDFSEASMDAVRFALSLSQESGARLTLLHVLEWPWPEPPPPAMEEIPAEQRVALAEYHRYAEESARRRLASLAPDSHEGLRATPVVKSGKPHVQILEAALDTRADLIVIGVHGRNPVDLALFGSTTNQVVRRAACPVLTVRR